MRKNLLSIMKEKEFKMKVSKEAQKLRKKKIDEVMKKENSTELEIELTEGLKDRAFESVDKFKKRIGFMTIRDYEKYKPSSDYIIQNLIYPNEIGMNFGDTGSFKSIHMLYKALCISKGKKYLGNFKVKRKSVGILSAENSKRVDKDRIFKIMRGLKIRKREIPLYIIPRSKCGNILGSEFKPKLLSFVKKLNIQVLFIDTINIVTPEIDDNKAKDVIKIFNDILKTLSDDHNCYVEFLHHTDKRGNQFLGSTKFKANCDNVTRIDRRGLSNSFKIYNEKNRDGEYNTIEIGINFTDKEIRFDLLREGKPEIFKREKKKTKGEILTEKIKQLCPKRTKRSEVIKKLKKNKVNFSLGTLDRVLREIKDE